MKELVGNADVACGVRHFETWNPGDCPEYDAHPIEWQEEGGRELIAAECKADGLVGDKGMVKLTMIICLMEERNISFMTIRD